MFEKLVKTLLKSKIESMDDITRISRKVAGEFKMPSPAISKILKTYREMLKKEKIKRKKVLEYFLVKRRVRTLSGVAIITVLTKPFDCPGKCVYCPSEKDMPKSYLSNEPAAMRAKLLKFNPYKQVYKRIRALEDNGHPTDKIELIVKGGTWSAYETKYQNWFIKRCFEACNERKSKNLESAQKINERAKHRVVGLTLETRPDCVNPNEIKHLREMGCTRVELGVQTVYNNILHLVKRGHKAEDVIQATKLLKNAGFKVDYHLMPMLPGSTSKKDFEMFKEIFKNSDYKPDMVKIYPCAVVPDSQLYKLWKQKKYKPYSNKKLVELLIRVKSEIIPRYCRISRLIRDIPSESIVAGNRITNLREMIQGEMKKRGLKCKCLRCREIGHNLGAKLPHGSLAPKLFTDKYKASGGTEYFLSFEDSKRKVVYAFLRLRISSKDTAFIRELHTYGHLVPIGGVNNKSVQHKGLGKKLMKEAEKIARQKKCKKVSVISGVGVRGYYKKLGYGQEETYMVKSI
ncbi:MAG: tRNA uridine(34) 5-carboxymethylaminomethyl modification radical SAM/GNAT enzyme Elp3 [Patescibacteria group bacterium]|nr:tRNA uridine(34) 5-carboxymethylaminomethyl modification radical SAM/GNAT enzyme Elp3 [Patescibacteria group bacterium]